MGLVAFRIPVLLVVAFGVTGACTPLEVPWRHHYDPRHHEHRIIYETCVDAGAEAFERCMQENLVSLRDWSDLAAHPRQR